MSRRTRTQRGTADDAAAAIAETRRPFDVGYVTCEHDTDRWIFACNSCGHTGMAPSRRTIETAAREHRCTTQETLL